MAAVGSGALDALASLPPWGHVVIGIDVGPKNMAWCMLWWGAPKSDAEAVEVRVLQWDCCAAAVGDQAVDRLASLAQWFRRHDEWARVHRWVIEQQTPRSPGNYALSHALCAMIKLAHPEASVVMQPAPTKFKAFKVALGGTWRKRKSMGVTLCRALLGLWGLDAGPLDAARKKDDLADACLIALADVQQSLRPGLRFTQARVLEAYTAVGAPAPDADE
jgi:hypothetical protein